MSQPVTFNRPAVYLDGGNRDGWVYYADEWDAKVHVALDGYSAPLPYRPTDRFWTHPNSESAHATCSVWEWTG